MAFPESLKKMIFVLENMVFLLIEKLKMIKRFTFITKFQSFSVLYWRLYKPFNILLSNEKKNRKLNM